MSFLKITKELVEKGVVVFTPAISPSYPTQGNYSQNGAVLFQSEFGGEHFSMTDQGIVKICAEVPEINDWQCRITHLFHLLMHQGVTPSFFYKNGRVKGTAINKFIGDITNRDLKNFPYVKTCAVFLEEHWDKLSQDAKKTLVTSGVFSEEGVCVAYFSSYYVLNEGLVRCNPNTLMLISPLLEDHGFSHQRIPDTDSREAVTFRGEEFLLTPAEAPLFYKSYTKCSKCGEWELKECLLFSVCRKCVGDFPRELRGYSERATATLQFKQEKSKYSSRYLGVELEYERTSRYSKEEGLYLLHRNLKEHAIFKRDGSLSDGIEICTRPASAIVHLNEVKKMFDDEECMQAIRVLPTCGMHVHIDRTKMSALTLGKLVKFMQSKDNKEFLELVAGREGNSYSRLATDESISSVHRGQFHERYRGVNMQNANTAEVRIFRTPDTFAKFQINIEFVTALADYLEPSNSGVNELSFKHFHKFVQTNSSSYRDLNKFLKQGM